MEPQLSSSRECQRSEPPDLGETSEPILERQRLSHPNGSQPPAEFWDKLSKIWLTKRALRELDRRNIQSIPSSPCSPHRRARGPVTRNFIAESKGICQTAQYTADYLRYYNPRISKDIELFARHGGPDLSDLRNVCISRPLPACAKADDAL